MGFTPYMNPPIRLIQRKCHPMRHITSWFVISCYLLPVSKCPMPVLLCPIEIQSSVSCSHQKDSSWLSALKSHILQGLSCIKDFFSLQQYFPYVTCKTVSRLKRRKVLDTQQCSRWYHNLDILTKFLHSQNSFTKKFQKSHFQKIFYLRNINAHLTYTVLTMTPCWKSFKSLR